jgi:hypothetical protein
MTKAWRSIPGETDPIKIDNFMAKLRLHNFTKEEAWQFLPMLEEEIQKAREGSKREYEKVLIGLTEILKMYLTNVIDIKKPDFDLLNELVSVRLSN